MSDPTVDDERLADLAAGTATFAVALYEYLVTEDGGNLFFSPYSISVALAMTYAGACGETGEQMRETLHYTLGEDIHSAFADVQAALDARATIGGTTRDEEVDPFQLTVANALWGKEGYSFAEEYLVLVETFYEGGLRRADFAGDPNGERERINEWVADTTDDRIEGLLPPDAIDPLTVLVLTNAVYFMASWQEAFDPEDTTDGTFTAVDGTESTVSFMHQGLQTNYASVAGAEAIELPYVGGEVSMLLILPDGGEFEDFEREFTADRLFDIFEELDDASGELALPRFEFETAIQLSEALTDLGMPDAFDRDAANFDGMVAGDADDPWIDEVFHEAFVSVDEEGTEAAAATAVVMMDEMMGPRESFDLRFDRPFLFCIRDRPTDVILFLGRVVDAGAAQ